MMNPLQHCVSIYMYMVCNVIPYVVALALLLQFICKKYLIKAGPGIPLYEQKLKEGTVNEGDKSCGNCMKSDNDDKYNEELWYQLPLRWIGSMAFLVQFTIAFIFFSIFTLIPIFSLGYFVNAVFLYTGIAIISISHIMYYGSSSWKEEENKYKENKYNSPERIAIIGAGPSGLCTAKQFLDEGQIPVIFEKSEKLGGLWQRGCPSMKSCIVLDTTVSSSSALNTCFSDFPIPAQFTGEEPYCIPQKRFMKYIYAYAKEHKLEQYIRYNSDVTNIEEEEAKVHNQEEEICPKKWKLDIRNTGTEENITEYFDFVVVCTGQTKVPKIPVIEGQENFKGTIKHSSFIQSSEDTDFYADSRVLCVGGGETASDIAFHVSKATKKCDISLRSPLIVLPRNYHGLHPDYYESLSLFYCPQWVRTLILPTTVMINSFFINCFARVPAKDKKTHWMPSARLILKCLKPWTYFKQFWMGKRSYDWSLQITKSENFLYMFNDKNNEMQSGIKKINNKGQVVFTNGTLEEYDHILLMTGYRGEVFEMLNKEKYGNGNNIDKYNKNLNKACPRHRYYGTFLPGKPTIAFVGFVRGNVGSLFLAFEMQGRWVARIVSGKCKLPSVEEMEKDIEQRINHYWKDEYNGIYEHTTNAFLFAHAVAKKFVKCEPNWISIFFKSPITWYKAVFGANSGYVFRFNGPHANPKTSIEGYALCTRWFLDLCPTWSIFCTPMFFISGMFCQLFWSKLPIIGRYFEPHNY